MFALILMFACGGSPEVQAPPAAPPPAAPAAAPAAPAAVGPEGPTSIAVPEIAAVSTDPAEIAAGEAVWGARGCGGCHAWGSKLVGPDLTGIFTRRPIPWVERMVLEPERMVKEDPVAKDLFRSLMVQMPKQGVTPEELPKLLAYIKSKGG